MNRPGSHLIDRLALALVVLVSIDALDHDGSAIDQQLPLTEPDVPEADLP